MIAFKQTRGSVDDLQATRIMDENVNSLMTGTPRSPGIAQLCAERHPIIQGILRSPQRLCKRPNKPEFVPSRSVVASCKGIVEGENRGRANGGTN